MIFYFDLLLHVHNNVSYIENWHFQVKLSQKIRNWIWKKQDTLKKILYPDCII